MEPTVDIRIRCIEGAISQHGQNLIPNPACRMIGTSTSANPVTASTKPDCHPVGSYEGKTGGRDVSFWPLADISHDTRDFRPA